MIFSSCSLLSPQNNLIFTNSFPNCCKTIKENIPSAVSAMWPQSAITNISNCYIAGNVSIHGPDRRQPVFMSKERYHLIFWLEEIYHNFEKYHTISRFSFVGNPVIYFVTVREGEKNIIFPFLCFLQHFSPIMQTPGIWGLQIIKLWK